MAQPFHRGGDELVNLRDLGCLRLDSGGRTRHAVLLRSGAPLPGDKDPTSTVWPPKTVFDLRGAAELGGRGHPLARWGTAVYACPFLSRPMVGPGADSWSVPTDLGELEQRGHLGVGEYGQHRA